MTAFWWKKNYRKRKNAENETWTKFWDFKQFLITEPFLYLAVFEFDKKRKEKQNKCIDSKKSNEWNK